MPIPVSTRVHEWLADRISWVQYPRLKPLAPVQKRPFFKYQMPWTVRLLIGTVSLVVVIVSSAVLLVMGLAIWGVLFGSPT